MRLLFSLNNQAAFFLRLIAFVPFCGYLRLNHVRTHLSRSGSQHNSPPHRYRRRRTNDAADRCLGVSKAATHKTTRPWSLYLSRRGTFPLHTFAGRIPPDDTRPGSTKRKTFNSPKRSSGSTRCCAASRCGTRLVLSRDGKGSQFSS